MPTPLVKKLAEENGIDIQEAEKWWDKAMKIVEEQAGLSEDDGEDYWKYVVGVFKKSMGAGEDDSISESSGGRPGKKDRLKVVYPQRVREARSFSEILQIFSMLFPYAVDSHSWDAEYEAAKKFRVLFEGFQQESDVERKYEIACEMEEFSRSFRYKGGFLTMAGDGAESREVLKFVAPSSIGAFLLERNCQEGENAIAEIIPDYKEKLSAQRDLQARMDQIERDYGLNLSDTLLRKKEEVDSAKRECGVLGLQTRADALKNEQWEWTRNHTRTMPLRSEAEAYARWQRELDDYNGEKGKRFQELMDKSYELENIHVKPVRDRWNAEIAQAENERNREVSLLQEAERELEDAVGGALIFKILESSPVTKEDAGQWVKNQRVSKSAVIRLKKQGYEESALRDHMAEFYRLTGGRIGKAFIETKGDKRAKAAFWDGTIYIDGSFTKRTLFHEMGHLLEREPKLEAMAETFRDGRAKKEKGTKTLKSITNNPAYRSDEVAYTDDFFDPYVGKVYRNNCTEVLSMGTQMFSSPQDATFLASRDPQMFNMMLGFMLSKPTAREIAKKEMIQEVASDMVSERDRLDKFYQTLTKRAKDGSFWEGKGSGLISRLEGYGNGKGSGKTMVLYYYPGDLQQGPGEYVQSSFFKNRQAAKNFAYLYLLYVQKGIITSKDEASRLSYAIANCVLRKTIPPKLTIDDLPTFIEELK